MKIDQTVKKETMYIAAWGAVFSLIVQAVFLIIGKWDYTALTGNLFGYAAATLNFFLMGLTVQNALTKSEDDAKAYMKLSHTLRNLMLIAIGVIGIAVPVFNGWAVLISLFFPRISIMFRSFFNKSQD